MADVVAAADVDQGLAGFPSRNGLLALVVRQFRLSAHHHLLCFGALPAFAGATPDQFPLKLGEAAQDDNSDGRMLLLLANFGKEGSPQPISPNISQETLAEMIGTTRSRVSHFMNKFRKLGLISYNGHIEVHNSLLSAVLHEKPVIKDRE